MNARNESKPALKSMGVWGSLMGLVGVVGALPELIELIQTLQPAIKEIINQAMIVVGLLISLWGRVKATKVIEGILVGK